MLQISTRLQIIYLLFFVLISSSINSQTFQWATQMGSEKWDQGIGIAVNKNGNIITTGNFYDTVDFDPGSSEYNLISKGAKDIYISKLNPSGELIWAKQIGGSGWEEINAISLDENGNIYLCGSFLGKTDFDPGIDSFNLVPSSGDIDAFICKLDSSGNFMWVRQLKSTLAINAFDISVDDSGNVFTTGYFDGVSDFDPSDSTYHLTVQAYSDIFIHKLDSAGQFVWVKQLGGMQGAAGHSIAIDNDGSVYSTGTFGGTVDFDPGPDTFNLSPPIGMTKMYVSKLSASGKFAWAKALDGSVGYSIVLDDNGNIYTTGDYNWEDISINKLDSKGNILWDKKIGAFLGNSMDVADNGNLFVTGRFYGTRDFDPGVDTFNLTAIGSTDSYVLKLDREGNFQWVQQIGGSDEVLSRAIAIDDNGNIYSTGNFNGTADFDPGPGQENITAIGSYDVFVQKMRSFHSVLPENIIEDGFKIYPNPSDGKFIIEFQEKQSQLQLILRNMLGQVITVKNFKDQRVIEFGSNLPSGIYLLEVTDKNHHRMTVRIVKK